MLLGLLQRRLAADTDAPWKGDPIHNFYYAAPGSLGSVSDDAALKFSACWSATGLLSGTAAQLPLSLYQRTGSTRRVMNEHSAHQLVHLRPNPEMGSMLWRSAAFAQQINGGNSYNEIERAPNARLVNLWPIHSSRIPRENIKRVAGKLVYHVRNDDGTVSPIPAADMLHVPSYYTRDGIMGMGVLEAARERVGFGLRVQRSGEAFFENDASPGVVLKHPGHLKQDTRDALRRQWNEIHAGPRKKGKTAILQEGMSIETFGFSMKDAEFIASEHATIEDICRYYRVPPHMIQHLLRATFNNIEHMGTEFAVYSLAPWLKVWEETLAIKLLTEEERAQGYYFKFNVNALMRGDSTARSGFYRELFHIGVLSINDILELEDQNPIEGGDVHFVPLNMAPLETVLAKTEEPEDPPAPPAPVEDEEDDAPSEPPPEDSDPADMSVPPLLPLLPLPSDVHRALLAPIRETLARLCDRKESPAVSRAAEKPGVTFYDWMDSWYSEFEGLLTAALVPACAPLAILKGESAESLAKGNAANWCNESREFILAEMQQHKSPRQCTIGLKEMAAAWPVVRPLTFRVFEGAVARVVALATQEEAP